MRALRAAPARAGAVIPLNAGSRTEKVKGGVTGFAFRKTGVTPQTHTEKARKRPQRHTRSAARGGPLPAPLPLAR